MSVELDCELGVLSKMADCLEREDKTCMCDDCMKYDEFVERLRNLILWVKEEEFF